MSDTTMDRGDDSPPYVRMLEAIEISRRGQRNSTRSNVLKENSVEVYINDIKTMRITCTPSNLCELAVGRLFTEGFISDISSVKSLELSCDHQSVWVLLNRMDLPNKYSSVEEVPTTGGVGEVISRYTFSNEPFEPYPFAEFDAETVFELCDSFFCDTPIHSLTSGTHSCRLAVDGKLVFISEDIGRHNALDKVIGYALLNSIDFSRVTVFISGRIPVDMAAKAIKAKIAVLATKAVPTDQAVKLAREFGLTLICLANPHRLLVFSGKDLSETDSHL